MSFDEKSLNTLELPKVRELLAQQAVSERAKECARTLTPSTSLYECEKLQQQCADAVYYLGLYGSPPFGGMHDVSDALGRAERGGALNAAELLRVASLLRAARQTKGYLDEHTGDPTSIDELFHALAGNRFLEDGITNAIASEDEVADSASDELYDIRRKMRQAQAKVRDVLARITSSPSYAKMLQDSIVTQRSGRFVVPVKSEYRGSFGGLVHDVSSSGATLFIEPSSVVELNNNLRVLEQKEKTEIERIFAELSAQVAQFSESIARDLDLLCALDFIFARAKLAYQMKAVRPKLVERGRTELRRAKHPLLDQQTAVPIDFTIGGACDTVIITGPNTGGKTVSLKTLGLLTVMAQCGLQIPAGPGSAVLIRDNVLCDIGDEQSIEQSLSTFSSHMKNIIGILAQATGGTLVLLDELGAGTDPVEGAALAVAIIEHLREQGALLAVTTHYAELKVYALETRGVENASCEFDVQSLKPTYRLVFGVPGKSNAFAISERLGLDAGIIARASGNVSAQNKQFEAVIAQLEDKRQHLEQELGKAEALRRDAEQAAQAAKEKLATVEQRQQKELETARRAAQDLLARTRAECERALDDIKRIRKEEQDGKQQNLSEARAALRGQLSTAEEKLAAKRKRVAAPPPRPIQAGDTVELLASGTKATVIKVGDGKVYLQAGILKVTVRQDEVRLLEGEKPKPAQVGNKVKLAAPAQVSMELDLRGQNAEEALMEVDRFIDNAIRLRLPKVTIIHGKGTGVLRKAVQAHLKMMPQVKNYRLGTFGEGESGVTIAELK